MTYDIKDFSAEEIEAVERSGKSTWQDYATIPSEWPCASHAVVPLMEARPGPVERWTRPVEPMPLPRRESFAATPREVSFIQRYWNLSNANMAHAIGRDVMFVRRIRGELGVTREWAVWNTERERKEAKIAWALCE